MLVCVFAPTEPVFVSCSVSHVLYESDPFLQCRQQNPCLPGSHRLSWAQSNIHKAICYCQPVASAVAPLYSSCVNIWHRTSKDLNTILLRHAFPFRVKNIYVWSSFSTRLVFVVPLVVDLRQWLCLFVNCMIYLRTESMFSSNTKRTKRWRIWEYGKWLGLSVCHNVNHRK